MKWFKEFLVKLGLQDEDIGSNLTPRALQVLALARKEAGRFHHNYVGTEHVLLGLIKLGQGVAVNVLAGLLTPRQQASFANGAQRLTLERQNIEDALATSPSSKTLVENRKGTAIAQFSN